MDMSNGARRSEGRRLAEDRLNKIKERDKLARKERETIRAADAAKTARLRALRLARDAAELAAAGTPPDAAGGSTPPPVPGPARRKKAAT